MKPLYLLGAVILFAGLLWMMLPHASHIGVLGEEDQTSHFYHVIQGLVFVPIGLGLMIYSNKREKRLNINKFF